MTSMTGTRTNRLRTAASSVALGGVVWWTLACGESTAPNRLVVEIEGRLERSATVALSVTFEGRLLPDSEVTWSATPPTAVTLGPGPQAVLDSAGPVTILAGTVHGIAEYVAQVQVPPTIVFDLLRDGNRDIYRAALDGLDTLRLTTSLADDSDPTVAGDVVVFVSYRDGNGELYATTLDGGVPVRLTTNTVTESSPTLSAGGTRLAYTRSDTGVPKLWTAAPDGSNATRVTESFGFEGSIEASPTWAPGGDQLAFVSTSEGTADLFRYTLATEQFSLLVPDSLSSAEVEPAWSPDGTRIAFATNRLGDTEIYLLEVATGALTRLTDRAGADGQPTWTDDSRLVWVAWTNGIPALKWVDPSAPADVRTIEIGASEPGHPSGIN